MAEVREREPAEELAQLAVAARPEHHVPVVGHEAPVEQADRAPPVGLDQEPLEGEVVPVLAEEGEPSVGAVEDVEDRPAGGVACGAGHDRMVPRANRASNNRSRHVYFAPRSLRDRQPTPDQGGMSESRRRMPGAAAPRENWV